MATACPDCAARPAWLSRATGWAKCSGCGLVWRAVERPDVGTPPDGVDGGLPGAWKVTVEDRAPDYRSADAPKVRVELLATEYGNARTLELEHGVLLGEKPARLERVMTHPVGRTMEKVLVETEHTRFTLVRLAPRSVARSLVRAIARAARLHLRERDGHLIAGREPAARGVSDSDPADIELRKRRLELLLGAAFFGSRPCSARRRSSPRCSGSPEAPI